MGDEKDIKEAIEVLKQQDKEMAKCFGTYVKNNKGCQRCCIKLRCIEDTIKENEKAGVKEDIRLDLFDRFQEGLEKEDFILHEIKEGKNSKLFVFCADDGKTIRVIRTNSDQWQFGSSLKEWSMVVTEKALTEEKQIAPLIEKLKASFNNANE